MWRVWVLWLAAAVLFMEGLVLCSFAAPHPVAYVSLKQQLMRQGLDRGYIVKVFSDARNEFLPDIVRKIAFLRKERPADYAHFLRPEVVAKGRQYLKKHHLQLASIYDRYGVSPEVIVAILTVESGLGDHPGKYPVFNVFASLSVMDTPEVIKDLGLPAHLYPRLKKKAAWAQRELSIFLEYCRENRLDPFAFRGSWAGAIGYPQFLPSSLASYGQDGDGDGKVDLFNHADAMASIANYLKKSGFQADKARTWRRAVLAYNHSEAYADTVLTLARWY